MLGYVLTNIFFNFCQMNGFPNGFYGWGGEDDEMAQRTNQSQLTITRQSGNIARYTMLTHKGVCFMKFRWKIGMS